MPIMINGGIVTRNFRGILTTEHPTGTIVALGDLVLTQEQEALKPSRRWLTHCFQRLLLGPLKVLWPQGTHRLGGAQSSSGREHGILKKPRVPPRAGTSCLMSRKGCPVDNFNPQSLVLEEGLQEVVSQVGRI